MDREEFEVISQQLLMFGNLVKDMELDKYIQAIDRADAVGPIMDPTLWRKAHEKTAILKQMAEGLNKFKSSLPTEEQANHADMTQLIWEGFT